jgi:enoyl-[acyl-carrier protein] reductase III
VERAAPSLPLEGQVAVVTGAARGIGREIALELARRGAAIAFNYLRSHAAAAEVKAEIEGLGGRCFAAKAHLGDPVRIREFFAAVDASFGKLDILVNNAASGVASSARSLTERQWAWSFDINARAPWLCTMQAAQRMSAGGRVVNVSSEGSRRVLAGYFATGASKATLEAITRYLAVELAGDGIAVNAVSAGLVDTDALDAFPDATDLRERSRSTPAGRGVTPIDVARAVAFLCSADAAMIRGHLLVVDGGVTLLA